MVFKERRRKKRNNETELNTEEKSEDSIQKSFSFQRTEQHRCSSLVLTHQDRDRSSVTHKNSRWDGMTFEKRSKIHTMMNQAWALC